MEPWHGPILRPCSGHAAHCDLHNADLHTMLHSDLACMLQQGQRLASSHASMLSHAPVTRAWHPQQRPGDWWALCWASFCMPMAYSHQMLSILFSTEFHPTSHVHAWKMSFTQGATRNHCAYIWAMPNQTCPTAFPTACSHTCFCWWLAWQFCVGCTLKHGALFASLASGRLLKCPTVEPT